MLEGVEGDSSEGEKKQSPNPFPDGVSGRFKTQLGRETKSLSRTPNTPGETSSTSELEVEGDDNTRVGRSVNPEVDSSGKLEGTWTASSGRAWRIRPKSQEKAILGSGQAGFVERGPASDCGSFLKMGRAQGR